MALGAAAGSLSILTNPLQAANTIPLPEAEMHEAEKWMTKIKGKHRMAYDGSTPHDGFPIVWNWAFYLTNNETGVPDEEITAMTVLRHSAIPFALDSSVWEKYKLGEFFQINDNSTGNPSLRNPMYEPQEGDMPLPPIQGIKDLQARGAMFWPSGSPPVKQTQRAGWRSTSARISSRSISEKLSNSVSQKWQRRLHLERRTKVVGWPTRSPSPSIE